jgi:hypothetical protein
VKYDELQNGTKLTAQRDTNIVCAYDLQKRQDIFIAQGDVYEAFIVRKAYFTIRKSEKYQPIRLPRSFYNKYFRPDAKTAKTVRK